MFSLINRKYGSAYSLTTLKGKNLSLKSKTLPYLKVNEVLCKKYRFIFRIHRWHTEDACVACVTCQASVTLSDLSTLQMSF